MSGGFSIAPGRIRTCESRLNTPAACEARDPRVRLRAATQNPDRVVGKPLHRAELTEPEGGAFEFRLLALAERTRNRDAKGSDAAITAGFGPESTESLVRVTESDEA